MKKQVKTFFKSLDCLYRFRVQFAENNSLVMQFSWTLSVILNNESYIPLSFFWSAFLLIVFVFFFTSFHLSEYTYWFVISVNKGTSQCICSKKFYFPIRTLPLDSSLHNYKKKRCVRNTEFNLNHREKVLTRVVKLYSPFTEASKKNFFHRSAILSKTRILQDGRENMR